jgi:hypothetical protein
MKKKVLVLVFLVLVTIGVFGQQQMQFTNFRVDNNTGYTVHYIYVRPSGWDNWGYDQLGRDVLSNGYYLNFTLTHFGGTCDVILVDSDGDYYIKKNIWLNADVRVTFTFSDLKGRMDSHPPRPQGNY